MLRAMCAILTFISPRRNVHRPLLLSTVLPRIDASVASGIRISGKYIERIRYAKYLAKYRVPSFD